MDGTQDIAIFTMDSRGTILTWNPGVERILGYTESEWLGQHIRIIFTPEDQLAGEPEKDRESASRKGRAAASRRHIRKDGTHFQADSTLERLDGNAGECVGFVKVLRDTTADKPSTQSLLDGEKKYRTLFNSIDVGFCIIEVLFDDQRHPYDYRFLETNPAFERHTGLVDAVGRTIKEYVPGHDTHWFETYGGVALTGEAVRLEDRAEAMGRWFDVYAFRVGAPGEHQVAVFFTDITARKKDQEALQQSEERLRASEERERSRLVSIFMQAPAFMAALRGPNHIFELANPPYYQLVGHRDIIGKPVAEALPEVVGQGFVGVLDRVYQTGEPFVGNGISLLLQVEPEGPPEERFLDFTYQPLFESDGAVSGILAHGIDLTEHRRLEAERERLLEEQRQLLAEAQARAEREALVNTVGAAIQASPSDPEAILQATVTALGQGLGTDRCYYVHYDQAKDTARIGPEWHREGVKSIAGREFRMSAFSVDRDPWYRAGNTHIVNDTIAYSPDDADSLLQLGVRALVRVPIQVGNEMTALGVTSAEPRIWSRDEVRVMETVASQIQPALNAARLQLRERTIATQLQDALIPPDPPPLPGMSLKSFY
ncbi:MAG: PAS domain S-box protein, partial [Armatimonadota bacterium]